MLTFVKDNIENHLDGHEVILVGTNQNCSMAQGFQRFVMLNYPYVQEKNLTTNYGDTRKLGLTMHVEKQEEDPEFCICYMYRHNTRPDLKTDTVAYDALEQCLEHVASFYSGRNIGTTLMGASKFEGGGDRNRILDIFHKVFDKENVMVTVYDYEQKSRAETMKEIRQRELEVRDENINEYYRMVSKRKAEAEERFRKNGHVRY